MTRMYTAGEVVDEAMSQLAKKAASIAESQEDLMLFSLGLESVIRGDFAWAKYYLDQAFMTDDGNLRLALIQNPYASPP